MTLMEEIKNKQMERKMSHDHRSQKLMFFKCSPPKAAYRFMAILINIPVAFFTKIDKRVLKFLWNHRTHQSKQS